MTTHLLCFVLDSASTLDFFNNGYGYLWVRHGELVLCICLSVRVSVQLEKSVCTGLSHSLGWSAPLSRPSPCGGKAGSATSHRQYRSCALTSRAGSTTHLSGGSWCVSFYYETVTRLAGPFLFIRTLYSLPACSHCVRHCIWIWVFSRVFNVWLDMKNLAHDAQGMCRLNYISHFRILLADTEGSDLVFQLRVNQTYWKYSENFNKKLFNQSSGLQGSVGKLSFGTCKSRLDKALTIEFFKKRKK